MPLLRRLAGVAVALACLWSAAAPAAETVRVGVLKYGTVNWEISIIQRHEMDVQHGFHLEVLELASDQATAVALQAGEVDIIVSDWLWEIGRAHVCTPVTNAHLVCRLLLEKKKQQH